MHMHAFPADTRGPPPIEICAPIERWAAWDPGLEPAKNFDEQVYESCSAPISSPMTNEELLEQTLATMNEYNIIGMLGGRPENFKTWIDRAPDRFIPSLDLNLRDLNNTPDEILQLANTGSIHAIFELMTQYHGIPANDPELHPIYELAEDLELPVGIHFGQGPPGLAYLGSGMRASLSSPLLLEEMLLKFPKMRVWVSHGAYPFQDELKAMLLAHPQLRFDVGIYSFILPEAEYHRWLCDFVEAGFSDRIMFGSDSQIWPQAIAIAVDRTNRAPCLGPSDREDIFFNNAAAFLRLSEERIAEHRSAKSD